MQKFSFDPKLDAILAAVGSGPRRSEPSPPRATSHLDEHGRSRSQWLFWASEAPEPLPMAILQFCHPPPASAPYMQRAPSLGLRPRRRAKAKVINDERIHELRACPR